MVGTTIRSGWVQLTSVDTRDIAISHFATVEDDTRTRALVKAGYASAMVLMTAPSSSPAAERMELEGVVSKRREALYLFRPVMAARRAAQHGLT